MTSSDFYFMVLGVPLICALCWALQLTQGQQAKTTPISLDTAHARAVMGRSFVANGKTFTIIRLGQGGDNVVAWSLDLGYMEISASAVEELSKEKK